MTLNSNLMSNSSTVNLFSNCTMLYICASFVFRKGDEVQKLSVVQSLPSLITQDASATLNKVIPKIQQELLHSSSEFQITTSHIFQILISNYAYTTENSITSTLLQNLDSKDPVVANAWLETLLEVIKVLPSKTIQSEVSFWHLLYCMLIIFISCIFLDYSSCCS